MGCGSNLAQYRSPRQGRRGKLLLAAVLGRKHSLRRSPDVHLLLRFNATLYTAIELCYLAYCTHCGIILLRPVLGGEAEATAREHAARRDARLQPFGRAREKGVAHWLVTRSRLVVHLRERPVTG